MSDRPSDRWQSRVTSISSGICELYRNKDFTDVKIKINKQDPFKAHKFVLSARSPVFKAMLLDSVPESEVVVIEDESLTPVGCEILFRFIYTNQMGTQDKKSIIQAYLAARHFGQKELMSECEEEIKTWILTIEDNNDNVWHMMDAGYTIDFLREKCITVIRNDVRQALSCSSFLNISCGCIDCLLESGVLRNASVMECLQRIMEWASKLQSQPVDYKLVRQKFSEKRLGKLRLDTLNNRELNEVMVNYKGLLTTKEVVEIFSYSKNNDATFLPSWCVPSF